MRGARSVALCAQSAATVARLNTSLEGGGDVEVGAQELDSGLRPDQCTASHNFPRVPVELARTVTQPAALPKRFVWPEFVETDSFIKGRGQLRR